MRSLGECTCSLIAPLWIITAEHCAQRKLKHEKTKVNVNFGMACESNLGQQLLLPPANMCPIFTSRTTQHPHVERGVTHCISASHLDVDLAICHLTAAVHAFPRSARC